MYATLAIPGGWMANSDPQSFDTMDWDFAVLEFADPPAYYPGDFTGWMGTQSPPQGQFIYSWMLGYPADKPPLPQQWAVRGNMYGGYTGDTWVHHYLDMYRGQSGACIYNDSWRCMSINDERFFAVPRVDA